MLLTEQDGQINWPGEKGLYWNDTRLLSSWNIYANGENWTLLNGGATTHYAARSYLTNDPIATEDGAIPRQTLALVIARAIGGGVHEDLDVTNHGQTRVRFNLEIALRSDFADIFEVKSGKSSAAAASRPSGTRTSSGSSPLSQPGLHARADRQGGECEQRRRLMRMAG